jgi:hypothetical protein
MNAFFYSYTMAAPDTSAAPDAPATGVYYCYLPDCLGRCAAEERPARRPSDLDPLARDAPAGAVCAVDAGGPWAGRAAAVVEVGPQGATLSVALAPARGALVRTPRQPHGPGSVSAVLMGARATAMVLGDARLVAVLGAPAAGRVLLAAAAAVPAACAGHAGGPPAGGCAACVVAATRSVWAAAQVKPCCNTPEPCAAANDDEWWLDLL